MLTIGSLFSGIGGLELGLEVAGVGKTIWQVEQDDFCRNVLAKHWPEAERFDDIKTVGANNLGYADIICGGFPLPRHQPGGKWRRSGWGKVRPLGGNAQGHSRDSTTIRYRGKRPSSYFSGARNRTRRLGLLRVRCTMGLHQRSIHRGVPSTR